jgi:polyisoprenoid-binding protein YceI
MNTARMATTATPAITAGTYDIDPVHSRVGFAVKHLGINLVRGRFLSFTGVIEIPSGLEDLTASGVVEAGSVDTAFEMRDEHLRSPDFFDVTGHPNIRFHTTTVQAVDGRSLQLAGDLTIRGITKPVVLDAELAGSAVDQYDNVRLGLSARGQVSRSDYEMPYSQASGGVPIVADRIDLALDLEGILRP